MSTVITAGTTYREERAAPPLSWSLGGMKFDAWLYLVHNNSLTITQHPVETGATITDHSFVNPKRFSFSVGMTDVVGGLQGSQSRSVNAYNKLVEMQNSREPLPLVSKYGVFNNILIADVSANDNFQTKLSGRFTITLQEVILTGSQKPKVSGNPQATNQTNRGNVAPQPITPGIQQAITKVQQGKLEQSLKTAFQSTLPQLQTLFPRLPVGQIQLALGFLDNLTLQELINLSVAELTLLFPELNLPEAQKIIALIQAQIRKAS